MKIIKRIITCVCIAALCLTMCACGKASAAQSEKTATDEHITFTDDLGNEVSLAKPGRVAALIGSYADIWCLAGGKDTLVAAANDSWTSFDLGLSDDVINIGSSKEPSLEKLLASKPDFILASCNTAADLELQDTFIQAGIPAAFFDVEHIDDYMRMLKVCTDLTGCTENYEEYGVKVKAIVDEAVSRSDGSTPTVLCMRATGSSCKVKGSDGFLLGEMLKDMGCINVADSETSLLDELSLEGIIAADPDYIFVALQGSDPSDAMETLNNTLLSNPAWQQLGAVKNGNFYTMENSLYNIKPNARWGEAYEKLADILYPEAK